MSVPMGFNKLDILGVEAAHGAVELRLWRSSVQQALCVYLERLVTA